MSNQKILASLVILVMFGLSFANIEKAISHESGQGSLLRSRLGAQKAEWLRKIEAIKAKNRRGHGHEEPPSAGASWQGFVCDNSCVYPSGDFSASFVTQTQLEVKNLNLGGGGGCVSDDVGFLVNLPPGTQAGTVTFDQIIDSINETCVSLQYLPLQLVAFDSGEVTKARGSIQIDSALPVDVGFQPKSFDLQNMTGTTIYGPALSAPPGTEISFLLLFVAPYFSGGSQCPDNTIVRFQNLRVNNVPVTQAILQQRSCPSGTAQPDLSP